MNKYFNIILVSFFSVLTFTLDIGFSLFIPIICFLTFKNSKNILLIIPSSLMAMLWFNYDGLMYLIITLAIIILYIIISRNKNYYLDLLFIFVLNIGMLIFEKNDTTFDSLIIFGLLSLISVVLYGYFGYNMEGALINQNRSRNFAYVEVIMAIASVIGATTVIVFDIHISIFVAMYFSMYLSKNQYPIHSVFFSLMIMFFLRFQFNIQESLLIPFVSAFYIFPSLYAPVTLISFCMLGWLTDVEVFSVLTLQITIGLSLFFEIIKFSVINNQEKNDIIHDVYHQAMDNVNAEVIAFAAFLDLFAKDFSTPKEYTQKLSEGINNLTHYYCESCYVRNECYTKNKGKLYTYFKNLILYSKRSESELNDAEATQFFKNCPYIVEMRKSSMIIHDKLNIAATSTKTNSLIAQLNGISNVLRQYSVDNSLKTEIDYETFFKIHRALCDYGLNICLFETKKITNNDFLIEVGIKGETFNPLKVIVEEICNNYIPNKTTVLFKSASKGKVYINIVPKINFEIEYGYGSIAQEGNSVCGDNYLIKNLSNAKFIAAISDGMGKGYVANQESATTLKLVDEITNTSINTETSLQILNTFYYIQDYLEKYSTLDFLEIDRTKGELLFYKMGAASSYLFHSNGVYKKIVNESLPFGIEEIIEAKKFEIQDGDLIIMASDGIFENIVNEKELEAFIKGIIHLSPQKITYEILNYARSHKTKTIDDMSVIALKIMSNL